MHAYMIEQAIKSRSMREWTEISMSSVYKLLRKLEKDGLVCSKTGISKNNVTQKVYCLTPLGRKNLKEAIRILLSEPEHMIYRIDLATSHLCQLTKKEATECLKKYEAKLIEGLKCYRELEKYLKKRSCPSHGMALAQRPQYLITGELSWVRKYMRGMQRGSGLK